MTGEELNRKYHELCGWVLGSLRNGNAAWLFKGDDVRWHGSSCTTLPPLHLDANLAIAEAVRVLTNGFSIDWCPADLWCVVRYQSVEPELSSERHHSGETFCIAILKALIAAKEQQ